VLRSGSAVSLNSQTTCNTLAFSSKSRPWCAYCHHRRRISGLTAATPLGKASKAHRGWRDHRAGPR